MTRIVSAIAFGLLIGPAPLYAMPVSYGISTPRHSDRALMAGFRRHLAGASCRRNGRIYAGYG
ncbi:Uncharacterised protein [Raoultella terrigena]|uniref:Uncharacterized protein n=1 Tax=Raoultella terrigena TaxID=577 RepID=A0A4U9CZW1_RAOTE|nr:Uncharacterised protein [Raoultella terrigena]